MEKNDITKYYAPIWIQAILLILNGTSTFAVIISLSILFAKVNPVFFDELFSFGGAYSRQSLLGQLVSAIMFIAGFTICISLTHFEIQKLEEYKNRNNSKKQ